MQSLIPSKYRTVSIILCLTLVAALPRFYDLGRLSFYGDEEMTAFAARSVVEGHGAQMPSGMEYRRALPFTWVTALSARALGPERELSYRAPAAVFGTLTVPLLFALARPFVGTATALVAAVLLAVSEWHIITSREARMYAPFLFFYLGAAFALLHWTRTDRWSHLILAAVLFAVAVSLHSLGILLVLFALLPIVVKGWPLAGSLKPLSFAAVAAAAGYLYKQIFVVSPYKAWESPQEVTLLAESGTSSPLLAVLNLIQNSGPTAIIGTIIGISAGVWFAHLVRAKDETPGATIRTLTCCVLGAVAGACAGAGQLHGAAVAGLLFFLIRPLGGSLACRKAWIAAGVIVMLAAAWALAAVWQYGFVDGVKSLMRFPFPYPAYLGVMFPGVFALFAVMSAYLALSSRPDAEPTLRAFVMAAIIPVAAIGIIRAWGGMRYLIESYPFLLLVVAAALVQGGISMGRWLRLWDERTALFLAVVIAGSGVLGGHGVVQAARSALAGNDKTIEQLALDAPFYPDHKTPGIYVRSHSRPDDVIIAEDASMQAWYVGRVDYWLRDPVSHRRYLYSAPDSEVGRDIYVGVPIATRSILETLSAQSTTRIWVITSGETYSLWKYYLDAEQQDWLRELDRRHAPVFVGLDGVTKVYCLNCGVRRD